MSTEIRTASGMRPTGPLHLGHYFGVLKNWVDLQDKLRAFFFVADWHALTTDFNRTEALRENTIEMVKDWIGSGLDPEKCTIFRQSDLKEHAELSLLLSMITPVSWVERDPTYKEQQQQITTKDLSCTGFLCYPILMAADILMYKPQGVPVGEDQLPMLEQCKEIVHKFNSVYGETLTEPDIILPSNKACLRLPGIDGKAKMSKSLGNCIYLSDEAEDIKKKVMSMFTDPNHLRVEDPGQVEGNPVFIYLDAFCKQDYVDEFLPDYANLEELKEHYKRGGLGDVKVKRFLNAVMQEELGPIRAKRKELEQHIPEIYEILKKGSEEARKAAAETMAEVKRAMRINYFEDAALIQEQSERFAAKHEK